MRNQIFRGAPHPLHLQCAMRNRASELRSIVSSTKLRRPKHSGQGMASALGFRRAGVGTAIGVLALPPAPSAKSRSKFAVSCRSLPASLRLASWASLLLFLFFLPAISGDSSRCLQIHSRRSAPARVLRNDGFCEILPRSTGSLWCTCTGMRDGSGGARPHSPAR